jgi:hypothetical protein
MSQHNFLPETETLLKRLTEQSGYPVSLVDEPSLKIPATVSIGTTDRPIHIIRFHPDARFLDYLIAVQTSYALRLFSMPPEGRFQLSAKTGSREQIVAEVGRLNPRFDAGMARTLGEQLFDGLMLQARSCPTGIVVDLCLYRDCPGLRAQQRDSLTAQCQQNVNCLSGKYDHDFPKLIVHGNRAMNAAHAFFAADLLQLPHLAVPYRAVGLEKTALALLGEVTSKPLDSIDDRELITAWGAQLGIEDWFAWLPCG